MKSVKLRTSGLLIVCLLLPACARSRPTPAPSPQAILLLRDPAAFSSIDNLTAVGSTLYFTYNDGVHGDELWKSDGTPLGTQMVADIQPGATGSSPVNLIAVGGTLFFTANDGIHGYELWTSDGTAAGTFMLADTDPGPDSGGPQGVSSPPRPLQAVLGNKLIFAAYDGSSPGIWRSDGTVAGTTLVQSFASGVDCLTTVGDIVFFLWNSQLWRTDGTPAGTSMVSNAFAATLLQWLTACGNTLFFAANDLVHGIELWKSDGTSTGTQMVVDLTPGPDGTAFEGLVSADSLLYFVAAPTGLWQTDGTVSGTRLVQPAPTQTAPGFQVDTPTFVASGGELFFKGNDSAVGYELWKTDGSSPGTVRVEDINPGPAYGNPSSLIAMGGFIVFIADDGIRGYELWKSDGSTAGTRLLQDIRPASGSSTPQLLTRIGHLLFFTANDGQGSGLWQIAP
jgi:ELWxxDGT repeat protein